MDIYDKLKLQDTDILQAAEEAQDWAYSHGMVMRNGEHENLVNFAPFMLFPSPFPRYLYDEAMLVQKDFQTLYHLASQDHSFIEESLKSVIIHDEFTRKLYEIYNEVRATDVKPKFYFNVTRSDYMIDHVTNDTARPYEIKQIEMNMIAASFGGLGTIVGKLHHFMTRVMGDKCPYDTGSLPLCSTIEELGGGLAKAWQYYNVDNAVMVFVVQDGERNRIDQRLLEYSFYDNIKKLGYRHVPVLFRSLQEIYKSGSLSCDNRFLLDGKEVALFYFRAGYTPSDYTEEHCWKARQHIEKSVAVKCPTVGEQLVGTKKVQQIFAEPGVVEKFIESTASAKRIRRTFTGLYTLDPGDEGDAAKQMALDQPSKYVLKPQREGGGNNLYDEEMVEELNRLKDPVERSQYILMERIQPPLVKNHIVNASFERPLLASTVAEIGIFGVFISDGEQEVLNKSAGHMLRTKSIEHKDGGVAAGRAVLDTPCLI